MAAPDAVLGLAAAVHDDAVPLAVVDRLEQALECPEARRLDVHEARAEPPDVVDRVHRSIPAQARLGAAEGHASRVRQGGVLDDRVREALDHGPVEAGIGRLVDARAVVLPLQVDDANPIGLGETADESLAPVARRVELELEPGIELTPTPDLRPGRDDEPDGPVRTAERLAEGDPALPQREVERGALEGPAPVVPRCRLLRLGGEERQALEVGRERRDREPPGERQLGRIVVVRLRLVDDVLASAGLASAAQQDGRRHARELRRERRLAPLEAVVVDRQRELREPGEGAHRTSLSQRLLAQTTTGSTRRSGSDAISR